MKKTALVFVSMTLASAAVLNIQADAYAQSTSTTHTIIQDERARAGASSQSSGAVNIKFEGLRNIKEADLLKALREKGAEITKLNIKDPVKVYLTAHAVREILISRGYLNATVTVREEPAPSVTNGVVFIVNEGERARIAKIVFEGNKFLSDEQLMDSLKWVEQKYGLKCLPSGEYDSATFESCLLHAPLYLRSKGFLRTKFDTHKGQASESGLTLIVTVTDNDFYRLGAIKIEGGTVFTPEQLLAMLNLKAGDVANSFEILDWLQKRLKDAYGEMGYIQYEFDIEPDFQPPSETASGGVVNLKVMISEGRRFFFREIKFSGMAEASEEELRRLLYIHEGEPFNQKKLTESVKNLHRMGFSGGDADRDVDYRTSEAKGLIDIVIHLNGDSKRAAVN